MQANMNTMIAFLFHPSMHAAEQKPAKPYWTNPPTMRMSSGVAIATSVSARSEPKALYAHDRTDRMNLTAPMPLLATRMLQGRKYLR